MKTELKGLITISENGSISVPVNVQMRDFEIAELFGIMIPTVKSNLRAILKTGVVTADTTNGATLVGNNLLPDYFGLDMMTALAFRIHSWQAAIFRQWILSRAVEKEKEEQFSRISMDFKQLETCGVGMEVLGVQVSSIYILHILIILEIQIGNSPLAELCKLNLLDALDK